MSVSAPVTAHHEPAGTRSGAHTAYAAVIGVAAVLVLLQGVWAGIFIREGHDDNDTWVTVHARCADAAIVLAIVATGIAVSRLRARRDLVVGTAAFAGLLVVEAYLGGLIGNNPAVEIAHFPLAMGLLALAVWLPLRARTPRRAAGSVSPGE